LFRQAAEKAARGFLPAPFCGEGGGNRRQSGVRAQGAAKSNGSQEDSLGVTIIRTGMALPKMCVGNDRLETIVHTSDQWIQERTGIQTRYVATDETSLDMAAAAVRQAMETGPETVDPASIDLIIVTTITPDQIVPSMAAMVKRTLRMDNAVAFDINAACSGFVYGLWLAESLLKTGQGKRALVVSSERLTRLGNWEDPKTCVLFGDGAGCAIVERDDEKPGILGSYIRNYDDVKDSLTCGMEYRPIPFAEDHADTQHLIMHGAKVFRFAVTAVPEVMNRVLEETGVTADEVKFYVPHQANKRIIDAIAAHFGQPTDKFQIVIQKMGNVSAASTPMALATLMASGKVRRGDKIMLTAFGGGLSAAAMLIEAV
jgi:3-oxoacyl-[acyl-carrier-protein] synthase-3